MPHPSTVQGRTGIRRLRPWLLAAKLLGIVAVLGGFSALSAMRLLGPVPETLAEWQLLAGVMRAVFFPCVLTGMFVVVLSSLALFGLRYRTFARRRWFQVKALILIVGLPTLHLWGRGSVLSLYAAIEEGNLEAAAASWMRAGNAFVVALVVLLVVAAIASTGVRGRGSGVRD